MNKKALLALVAALMTAVAPAYAARTDITVQTILDPNGTIGAGLADLTWTAADVANMNSFTMTGKETVYVWNTDVGAHTCTLTSAADQLGRTKDITSYSVGASKISVFGPFATLGWRQSTGKFFLQANDATVKFAIVRGQ